MTYNFTHIDEQLHRSLILRLPGLGYSGYGATRISDLPSGLSNVIKNYHQDNIKTFEYNPGIYHNGYLRDTETISLFPSSANFYIL